MTRTLPRLAAASVASVLALSTAACGGNSGRGNDGDPASEQSTSVPSAPSTNESSGAGQLVTAGRLVLDRVSGTTLTSVEQDDGGWEITVAGDDGSATDASTNTEGTQITRGPTKDDDDNDDKAERRREVGAAKLTFEQAAAAVAKAAPGDIRELNLDTRDNSNQVVWEADVRNAAGNQVSVSIDAGSGAVVSTRSDNDDTDDD